MIKVLIADDHELMRDGLRGMLDAQDGIHITLGPVKILPRFEFGLGSKGSLGEEHPPLIA